MYKKIITVFVITTSLYAAPALVETKKVIEAEVNPLQEFIGTVNFSNNSQLAAKNSGLVEKINFKIGQKVKKGDILVKLDSSLINAQVLAAQANVDIAVNENKNSSKDFLRYEKLINSKSITQKEYDDALLKSSSNTSTVLALKAKLNELIIQRDRKNIKAPFDGIIVEKNINLAEWVNTGSIVARIINTSSIEATFSAPISFIEGLKNTNEYDLIINKKVVKAKLLAAIAYGDKRTRTFPIKFIAKVTNNFIYDGQEVRVKLSKSAKIKALVVPRDAVIKRFGSNMIFLNKDNVALMLPVKIISYVGKNIAVKANGLTKGADVIVKGNERVFPKQALKIVNK